MTPRFATSYEEVTDIRVNHPEWIRELARSRRTRSVSETDGRIFIVAADHPARGALGAGDDPRAMESRTDLLDRLRTALAVPGVDGVLGTADIIEDLLLLGALEDKIVFASMNRAGLQRSAWELDDRMTAYDPATIADFGFNGGKMLTRVDLDDERSVRTLATSAEAVTGLAERGLIAMVEPFMSHRVDGKLSNILTPEAVIDSVHIAQGLGATSAYTWLKLPVVPDMARVMAATTLPTVLLGGDPEGTPEEIRATWGQALEQPNVRGLVVGRTLLYPPDEDVAAAVAASAALLR